MATSPEPPPAVVTEAEDGRLISLTVGAKVPLRLDSSWAWDQPAVDGDVVALTQVDYFADPGFMEWIVTAVQRATPSSPQLAHRTVATIPYVLRWKFGSVSALLAEPLSTAAVDELPGHRCLVLSLLFGVGG